MKKINLVFQADFYAKLLNIAKKRKMTLAKTIEYLIGKFSFSDDTQTIMLQVPNAVLEDKELLADWLAQKTHALIHKLHP